MREAFSRRLRLASSALGVLCFGLAAGQACFLGPAATDGADAQAQGAHRAYFRTAEIQSPAPQDLARYPEADPGDAQRLGRSFPDAPPQIPHSVEDLLPITLDANDCLDCHLPSNAGPDDVPLPASHFRRPLLGEGGEDSPMAWVVKGYEQGDELAGVRYLCTTCHTPQATNARTVESTFTRVPGEPTR